MASLRPRPVRFGRQLWTYVSEHRRTVAVDVGFLTCWTLLLVALVTLGRLPRELLYVGLLAGVVSYSLVAGWREATGAD